MKSINKLINISILNKNFKNLKLIKLWEIDQMMSYLNIIKLNFFLNIK